MNFDKDCVFTSLQLNTAFSGTENQLLPKRVPQSWMMCGSQIRICDFVYLILAICFILEFHFNIAAVDIN